MLISLCCLAAVSTPANSFSCTECGKFCQVEMSIIYALEAATHGKSKKPSNRTIPELRTGT